MILDKANATAKNFTKDKKGHFTIIRELIDQEDIMTTSVHVLAN